MDKFISYDGLPISSGGAHGLGNKSLEEVYKSILLFLKKNTDNKGPALIQLNYYKSHDNTFGSLFKYMRQFGYFPNWSILSNFNLSDNYFSWKLSSKQIPGALKVLKETEDREDQTLVLNLLYEFKFIDAQTKEVLKGQEYIPVIDSRLHNSQLYLRLGKKSTCSVWFTFPFKELDHFAKEFFSSIKQTLPFKLSDKHWRIWRKSTRGNWIPKKLEIAAILQ